MLSLPPAHCVCVTTTEEQCRIGTQARQVLVPCPSPISRKLHGFASLLIVLSHLISAHFLIPRKSFPASSLSINRHDDEQTSSDRGSLSLLVAVTIKATTTTFQSRGVSMSFQLKPLDRMVSKDLSSLLRSPIGLLFRRFRSFCHGFVQCVSIKVKSI